MPSPALSCSRKKHHGQTLSLCALLMMLLTFASPCRAEVQEYGPEFQRFQIDVPAEWTATSQDNGLSLRSKDGKTVLVISIGKSEGKSAQALVNKIARNLSGTRLRKESNTTWSFYVTSDNVPVRNTLSTSGPVFIATSAAGDMALCQEILQSLVLQK